MDHGIMAAHESEDMNYRVPYATFVEKVTPAK